MKTDFSILPSSNSVGSVVEIMDKTNADYILIEEGDTIKGFLSSYQLMGYPSSRLLLDCAVQPFSILNKKTRLSNVIKISETEKTDFFVVLNEESKPTGVLDRETIIFYLYQELKKSNQEKEAYIAELRNAEKSLRKAQDDLEKRVEQRTHELSEAQAQLFQTSKLATLGEMSAGLGHEMNQPLGGISLVAKNFHKLMEREKLSGEEIESGLKDIEACVKRMSKIIQHIRTFARQDTLKFVEVNVNETIDSALSLLGEQLRLHEIEVVLNLDSDLLKVIGEPYQLEQVWINIISNARDALDEKEKWIADSRLSTIPASRPDREVTARNYRKKLNISTIYNPNSQAVKVSFNDNGIGMSKKVKDKVFEPFFTSKEVGRATGLGLSISYGIVESHKGKIELESKESEGTTVRVMLPAG